MSTFTGTVNIPNVSRAKVNSNGIPVPPFPFPNMYDQSSVLNLQSALEKAFGKTFLGAPWYLSVIKFQITNFAYYDESGAKLPSSQGTLLPPLLPSVAEAISGHEETDRNTTPYHL